MYSHKPFFNILSAPVLALNLMVVPFGTETVVNFPIGYGIVVVPTKPFPPNNQLFCWIPPKKVEVDVDPNDCFGCCPFIASKRPVFWADFTPEAAES